MDNKINAHNHPISSIVAPLSSHDPANDVHPANLPVRKKLSSVKIFLIIFAIVVVLCACGASAYYAYTRFFTKSPKELISKSFEKLAKSDSYKVEFKGHYDDFAIESTSRIHNKNKEVANDLKISFKNKDESELVTASIIGTKDNIYIKGTYSALDKYLSEFLVKEPALAELKTYQMLLPILKGEQFIHLDTTDSKKDYNKPTPTTHFSAEFTDNFFKKFSDAIILKSNKSVKIEGESHQVITFGFDKTKLLDAIDTIKDSDTDIKISQINSFKKAVESTDDWDEELIVLTINNKTGNLKEINLSIPQIDPEVVDKAIDDNLKDPKDSTGLVGLLKMAPKVKDLLEKKESKQLLKVGDFYFSDYNQIEKIEIPTNNVESKELLSVIQPEIQPLLNLVLNTSKSTQPNLLVTPSVTPTPVKPKIVTSPKITNPNDKNNDGFDDDFMEEFNKTKNSIEKSRQESDDKMED